MKLKLCVTGLLLLTLIMGYGINTISSADDSSKISKTI